MRTCECLGILGEERDLLITKVELDGIINEFDQELIAKEVDFSKRAQFESVHLLFCFLYFVKKKFYSIFIYVL